VELRNGRAMRDSLELDTNGFMLVTHETKIDDFTDEAAFAPVYDRELETLIGQPTGASQVMVFDHIARFGDVTVDNMSATLRPPYKYVHSDFSENAARRRLAGLLIGQTAAEERIKNRFAIIQIWRPVHHKVISDPLAVCDARTISNKDFFFVQRQYAGTDMILEIFHLRHNPAQEWYYFPEMKPNEALMFKGFDSDENNAARFTPHTAFEDPNSPAVGPPRESIESRAFAVFD
jgi:hypothetical protein